MLAHFSSLIRISSSDLFDRIQRQHEGRKICSQRTGEGLQAIRRPDNYSSVRIFHDTVNRSRIPHLGTNGYYTKQQAETQNEKCNFLKPIEFLFRRLSWAMCVRFCWSGRLEICRLRQPGDGASAIKNRTDAVFLT
jgi:hypothetical protein